MNPPSAELEAGGRVEKHSNGVPRICWHTIPTCGNPQWYGKPLKQRGLLSRQGGHSSRYWCQQDSVFARFEMRGVVDPHPEIANHVLLLRGAFARLPEYAVARPEAPLLGPVTPA